jgi:hypothetical protein
MAAPPPPSSPWQWHHKQHHHHHPHLSRPTSITGTTTKLSLPSPLHTKHERAGECTHPHYHQPHHFRHRPPRSPYATRSAMNGNKFYSYVILYPYL